MANGDIVYELTNPRSHIKSALIIDTSISTNPHWYALVIVYTSCKQEMFGGHRTIQGAKQYFSKNFIQPEYWGKNVWK